MLRPSAFLLLSATAIAWAPPAFAADDYDSCSHYIDSLPATLAAQGTWCLRHDLSTAIASGNAITIGANNITIDCNDFKIGGLAAGSGSTANGIFAADRLNATIRRCNLRGFHSGIRLEGANGSGHLVEDNRLDNNLFVGIQVGGTANRIQRNRVLDTGGADGEDRAYGIFAAANVVDNTVDGVFAAVAPTKPRGIVVVGDANEVRGNRIRGLLVEGAGTAAGILVTGDHATVGGNRVIAPAPVQGTGIIGHVGNSFCTGNLVANFSTPWDACQLVTGNASH